jgi:hypothetical protein
MIQPAHEVQQGAFARPGSPPQRHEFTSLDAEIHAAEDFESAAAQGVPFVNGLGLDE